MDNGLMPNVVNDNGLGGLLLGGLLFGNNGFGMNRGWGANNGCNTGCNTGCTPPVVVVPTPAPGYGGHGGIIPAANLGYNVGSDNGGQNVGIASIQGQLNALASEVNTNQLSNQMSTLATGLGASINSVDRDVCSASRDIIQGQGVIRNDVTNGNFNTLNSINGLGRDIMAQANTNALSQLNSFNILGTNVNQGFNTLGTNVQQGFNNLGQTVQTGFNNLGQATQQGFNNQAYNEQANMHAITNALNSGFNSLARDNTAVANQIIAGQTSAAAALAACCCDIKATISADGNATRALINDIRLADLNTQLVDAKNNISNLKQTNDLIANNAAQTSTILHHVGPLMSALVNNHGGGGCSSPGNSGGNK